VPLNLVTADRCRRRVVSLAGLLAGGEARDRTLAAALPGDTIVILTDLREASTTHVQTALGTMPEAFTSLAAISSSVSGRWLTVYPGRVPLAGIVLLMTAWLAVRLDRRRLLAAVLAGTATLTIAGVATFAFLDVQLPWFSAAAILFTFGIAAAVASFRQDHLRLALIRRDLDGRISPDKLQAILDQDALSRLEASEQVVTIMFIDIVGFSRAAEKQTPKEAFSSLKGLIDQMRRAVHDHGGVVDRTMGDGMLCVFGFDMSGRGDSGGAQHAIQAVTCAAEIQMDNMRRMLRAQKTKSNEAVFPLRIGVNTTGVYLGNLGDTDKTDLTVIGSGVNFAQRLETACDRHMVMLGAATRDLVHMIEGMEDGLRKRHIRVKHSADLVEAYEYDPFHRDAQLLLDGDEAYRVLVGIERGEVRWPVPYPGLIRVSTTYGDGEIVNFSLDGFTIRLPGYYAKDVPISLRMDTLDGELGARLERAGLESISLEVRWARPDKLGYVHGLQIKSLTKEQREEIIALLRDTIQRHGLQTANQGAA
jgi:class 3 adenylate cyclase